MTDETMFVTITPQALVLQAFGSEDWQALIFEIFLKAFLWYHTLKEIFPFCTTLQSTVLPPSFPWLQLSKMTARGPPCPEGTNIYLFKYIMNPEYLCTSVAGVSPRKSIWVLLAIIIEVTSKVIRGKTKKCWFGTK